ncbi:MAG: OadG family protein [Clostridia bacterium]|nr:OadG family protein [Clostridia bacterium]MBQ9704503.1 OadG family protein [Clostridia bacterium]
MDKFLLFAANEGDPATWIVCLLGVLVVFAGLAALIGIIEVMNRVCDKLAKKKADNAPTAQAAPAPVPVAAAPLENRQEIVAAVCAAVAEENGTDISAIRVVSFKKL